ncbi:Hypothetical protein (Fragment), partial [Durusdinium trenchii]
MRAGVGLIVGGLLTARAGHPLREVIFQDAKERVKELAVQVSGTEAKFTTLEHLDCEGPGFNELWKVLRDLARFELPSDSLRPLRQLRGWTDESSRADLGDAGIPAMSLTLKALAVMMHDECLNSAFQHVVEWDCLYFELGHHSSGAEGCQKSAYEHYGWWIDSNFTSTGGQEHFCHFGCATALVLTALASLQEDGVTDQNARAVMDQLQVAEALMGRGGDLDYASSSKWGGQLTGLAAVLIDYLASLGSSSREEGKSALAIARSLQPCDPILQLGCW